MRFFKNLCLLGLVLILAACESLPTQDSETKSGGQQLEKNNRDQYTAAEFDEIQGHRSKVYAWELTGSFSYIDPEESAAGLIKWDFTGDLLDKVRLNDVIKNENVTLIGPLGSGSVELISTINQATLVSGRERYNGANVEDLLMEVIGWRLPIDDMRFWLFGLPSPNNPGKFWLNDHGLLETLHQSEWEIEFERYDSQNINDEVTLGSAVMLPQKITAVHRDNQAKVKLVIKNFHSQQAQAQ